MNFYYFCIMKKWAINITVFVVAILMIRCANVVSPSGGPKDIKAPVVLEASPANNSTNFKGRSIHLTFDEFVTLNNPSNNVLISPPMNNHILHQLRRRHQGPSRRQCDEWLHLQLLNRRHYRLAFAERKSHLSFHPETRRKLLCSTVFK